MNVALYLSCVVTALLCAVLLLRGYARSRQRLLLWSGLCFVGLAINSLLVLVDLQGVPQVNLLAWRKMPAVIGVALLIYGLVWEER